MISRINSAAVPSVKSRISTGKNRISFLLFPLIVFALVCVPALALPTPPPGAGAGHFGQGIGVYWPYHASLMVTGFILLLTGFIVARYHKTKNWFRSHAILQVCGSACVIAGMAVGVYMVELSGLPPLRNIHEIFGVTTVFLVIITLALGYSIRRVQTAKNSVRTSHRWLGRITIALMAVTIVLGIYFLSLILRR
jgi:cytochrome b561